MGTRGTYGIRKNGVDKLTYNHYDSYPDYLGRQIAEFLTTFGVDDLHRFYDNIIFVEESSEPAAEQIAYCKENGFCDFSVSRRDEKDWYCLVRNLQGNFDKYGELINDNKKVYMTNKNNFIKNSLWCEYGYIINLDEETLEFYEGDQNTPQSGNRYGTDINQDGYYPCKLVFEIPLNEIDDVDKIVKMMEYGEDCEDIISAMENNPDYDLDRDEAVELGDRKIYSMFKDIDEAAESEARSLGLLTDENERYFDLGLFGKDLLEECGWLEFSTGRVVFCVNK